LQAAARICIRSRDDPVPVHLDEFAQRESPREPPLTTQPLELTLERLTRIPLARKAATLHPLRVAPPVRYR
jgi:hypothetical protein